MLSLLRRTALLATVALAACSSESTSPTDTDAGTSSGGDASTGTDSGGGGGGGGGGGSDAGTDASVEPVNACKTFVDRTDAGASRTITWDFSISGAAERCMKIQVGQTVTWSGDFTAHPLVPQGGDTPNPVSGVDTATGQVTFAKAGTFGYACSFHPAMVGAIQVVE